MWATFSLSCLPERGEGELILAKVERVIFGAMFPSMEEPPRGKGKDATEG